MDKLIDLESIKSMISSVIKENEMTEEEIAECGAACGCGGCGTTTADLGAEVQYLGDKKKSKKEFLDFGTTKVNGHDNTVDSNNSEEDKEIKEFLDANVSSDDVNVLSASNLLGGDKKEANTEDIDSKMASFLNRIKEYLSSSDEKLSTIEKLDKYQSVGLMLNDLLKEVGGLQELINLAKNGNTYAKEILDKFDLGETIATESTLEEDEVTEMARGILAPQEIAKREYATEYPEAGVKTADQFLRKVINNPEAPGYDKYIKRFSYLIRNSDDRSFSDIAANVELDNTDGSNDEALCKAYADALLGHRKSMAKTSYDSKGTINAYQRNILKRGPYYKPGRDMAAQQVSTGKMISNKYNEVDPTQSNKVLSAFFKSNDWNSLNDNQKIKEINIIKDEADLDEIGLNIVSKEEHNVLDRLLGDE